MASLFPTTVYVLCFLTSSACAILLARGHARTPARLLFWSALCFGFLALNNLAVIVDLIFLADRNYQLVRIALSLCAVGALLFGLIWDLEEDR